MGGGERGLLILYGSNGNRLGLGSNDGEVHRERLDKGTSLRKCSELLRQCLLCRAMFSAERTNTSQAGGPDTQ